MFILSKEMLKSQVKVKQNLNLTINKTDAKSISICVINDSPTLLEGIASLLEKVPNVNQIIKTSKADYFDKHATKHIDIVVTEIEFGEQIEESFVEQIKAISPDTNIIVYTRIENHASRNRLLQNGADAFIFLKDVSSFLEHIVKIFIRKKQRDVHLNHGNLFSR
ncbi:MAG: response regulator [Melioribacteraceae bacterium]|jgi:DNA-binding NarL/FixJ family response regulator|nr:response regulator [Melioribacteraceae bacterium]